MLWMKVAQKTQAITTTANIRIGLKQPKYWWREKLLFGDGDFLIFVVIVVVASTVAVIAFFFFFSLICLMIGVFLSLFLTCWCHCLSYQIQKLFHIVCVSLILISSIFMQFSLAKQLIFLIKTISEWTKKLTKRKTPQNQFIIYFCMNGTVWRWKLSIWVCVFECNHIARYYIIQ